MELLPDSWSRRAFQIYRSMGCLMSQAEYGKLSISVIHHAKRGTHSLSGSRLEKSFPYYVFHRIPCLRKPYVVKK